MTKDEISLLLYLETRAVDHCGYVRPAQMNATDFEIATRWNQEGFLVYKRATRRDAEGDVKELTYAVRLNDKSWEEASRQRRLRAERSQK